MSGYTSAKKDKQKIEQEFNSYKAMHFEIISQNGSEMFNFFYENNDLFQRISQEDQHELDDSLMKYKLQKSVMNYVGFGSILAIDQGLLRIISPPFTVPKFRLVFNVIKYLGGTILFSNMMSLSQKNSMEQVFQKTAVKYDFNYKDYCECIDILKNMALEGTLETFANNRNNYEFSQIDLQSNAKQSNLV